MGDEATVEQSLRRYAAAGTTEFWPVAFPAGDDPTASLSRTTAFLATLGPDL